MAELIARFKPGQNVPAFAKTAVVGGHFVKVVDTKTADGDYQVGHCGAGELAFGVAEADSAATTESAHSVERRVNVVRRGAIARVVPGATLADGDLVTSDATGRAVVADTGDWILGQCVADAASTAAFAEIDHFIGGIAA